MSRLLNAQPTQRSTMVAVAEPLPNWIETFLPQRGFVLELPVETASNRIIETATMKSVSLLVKPQAPKPVSKNVPSPSVKGPLLPPVLGGAAGVEVVAGGAGCCGVGVTGGLTTGVLAGIEGFEERFEERSMHFAEFCRLTVTPEEFEGTEAT